MKTLRKNISLFTTKGDTTVFKVLQHQIDQNEKEQPLPYLAIIFLPDIQHSKMRLQPPAYWSSDASGTSLKLVYFWEVLI